jgi:hypothetical protein
MTGNALVPILAYIVCGICIVAVFGAMFITLLMEQRQNRTK